MNLKRLAAQGRRRLIAPELEVLRRELALVDDQQQQVRKSMGILMAREIAGSATSCTDAEFTVYSQFGEDGIIEYLVQHCRPAPQTFVEIGVETYAEANTRFLAEHRLWAGLIVDQNPDLARDLARTKLDWRAQVSARSSFVTRDNVRGLVLPFAEADGLGLLSVDIDGVDYWILEQLIDVRPALVVCEYNALFGDDAAVTVPYDASFDRRRPEYHNVYYGASLAAFDRLLAANGYTLVGCNSAGNNAFFVRDDCRADVAARTVAEAYRPRRFVEHRDVNGALTGTRDRRRQLDDMRDLPLVDVVSGDRVTVGDVP